MNLSQSYRYQPIFYNSVNIYTQSSTPNHNNCISYQTSGRASHNNNNNNNFCGFCLSPSSIASNAQISQEIASISLQPQQEFPPQVITGNCKQFEPELSSSCFTELSSNDSFKQQTLITHFKNDKKRDIYVRSSYKVQTENMVSPKNKFKFFSFRKIPFLLYETSSICLLSFLQKFESVFHCFFSPFSLVENLTQIFLPKFSRSLKSQKTTKI